MERSCSGLLGRRGGQDTGRTTAPQERTALPPPGPLTGSLGTQGSGSDTQSRSWNRVARILKREGNDPARQLQQGRFHPALSPTEKQHRSYGPGGRDPGGRRASHPTVKGTGTSVQGHDCNATQLRAGRGGWCELRLSQPLRASVGLQGGSQREHLVIACPGTPACNAGGSLEATCRSSWGALSKEVRNRNGPRAELRENKARRPPPRPSTQGSSLGGRFPGSFRGSYSPCLPGPKGLSAPWVGRRLPQDMVLLCAPRQGGSA